MTTIIIGLKIFIFIDKENGLILYNEFFTALRLIYTTQEIAEKKLLINFV